MSLRSSDCDFPCMTASSKEVSKIKMNECYRGNYLSRTAPVNVFHSWLVFDESSGSLLALSSLSHCLQRSCSCTASARKKGTSPNASALQMSHCTSSRGPSVPKRRSLLWSWRTWLSLLIDIQCCCHDGCSRQTKGKEQMPTLASLWWLELRKLLGCLDPALAVGFYVYFIYFFTS